MAPGRQVRPEPSSPHEDFGALYGDRYRALVATAAVTTGSLPHAEEIVQDAFIDVLRRFDELDNPEAYLRRAVISRCTSWVRRRVVDRRHRSVRVPDGLTWTDPDTPIVVDAIARLPVRQRAAVVMRYLADWSERDIAEALGCRPGTVKSLLSRARAQLAKEFADDSSS